MNSLNCAQSREYLRAQTLIRFLHKSKRIYSSFTPFADEVTAFLHNVEQIGEYASLKEKRGKHITIKRKELKQTIARETSNLCKLVTSYAIATGNEMVLYNVAYTYTDIYTLTNAQVRAVIIRITNTITPLLTDEGFIKYGITDGNFTSLVEKANEYDGTIGQANLLNHASDYASHTINSILKKIKGNIAQFNRLLTLFGSTQPQFVAGFREACIINDTGVRSNVIEGSVTDSSSGEPIEGVTIIGEGKNKTTITNASGYYRLAGIKTGTHSISITAKGYETSEVKVKVIRGKKVEINIHLKAVPLVLPQEKAA